jgi:hypothetical protein
MTDHAKILDKIKKCLALSKSSNPHEAAAALRQARKLMELHGIEMGDVAASQAGEAGTKAGAKERPPEWEWCLSSIVGIAFDCRPILSVGWEKATWQFIGVGAKPKLACYAFEVLHRQVKASRTAYMGKALRRCRLKTKRARADLYAMAYVGELAGIVRRFAGENPDKPAIDAYVARKHADLQKGNSTNRNANRRASATDTQDIMAGQIDGGNASLWHGINGRDSLKLGAASCR